MSAVLFCVVSCCSVLFCYVMCYVVLCCVVDCVFGGLSCLCVCLFACSPVDLMICGLLVLLF